MCLCLSCRFVSPADSLRCGRCRRSFGGRLCPRHHLSPAGSQFCVQCGKQELTDATLSLSLGWLNRLLAWGIVLLCVSFIARHTPRLLGSLWSVLCWALIHLLGLCPCTLLQGAARILSWIGALLLLSLILPGGLGARFRALLFSTLRWTGYALLG